MWDLIYPGEGWEGGSIKVVVEKGWQLLPPPSPERGQSEQLDQLKAAAASAMRVGVKPHVILACSHEAA